MIEHYTTPIYLPGSTQARAHLGALIHDALQQMPRMPLPSKNTLDDAHRRYRATTALSYAQQAYSQTTLKALGEHISDDPTELDRRQARLDRDAYDAAKINHTYTFADPDATTRDKLQATLELKMAQTRLTERRRHRPT